MSDYHLRGTRAAMDWAASVERRRIRRLIAPHLNDLRRVYMAMPVSPVRGELVVLVGRIDAETKAPRKARKGK